MIPPPLLPEVSQIAKNERAKQRGAMLQLLSLSALLFVPGAHHVPSLRRRCRACVVAEVVPLPTSPKDIATQMSYAVQAALAAGKTELAISLPPGMRFGLFGDAGKQVIGTPGAAPSLAQAQRAEFELVFLCAEMFRGEGTCPFLGSLARSPKPNQHQDPNEASAPAPPSPARQQCTLSLYSELRPRPPLCPSLFTRPWLHSAPRRVHVLAPAPTSAPTLPRRVHVRLPVRRRSQGGRARVREQGTPAPHRAQRGQGVG